MKKINYPVGDYLIRLKNAVMAKNKLVSVQNTKLIKAVSDLLSKNGYLENVEILDDTLNVEIVYKHKKPVISDIYLISKPGLRVYMNYKEIEHYKKPYKLLLSTSQGIMFASEAVKNKIGGEVIAGIL